MQGVGRQDGPVEIEPAGELRRQVLGVGGTTPVAAEIDPAAAAETGDDGLDRFADGGFQGFILFYAAEGVEMGPEPVVDYSRAVHVVKPSLQNSKS